VLRVGLLGLGDAGRHHARALTAAQAEGLLAWTALGVRDVAKAPGELAARVVSGDALLAGGLCDAVIIATPDGLHFEHARRAIAAGLHVLVEKPLALEVDQAEALVRAAGDRVLQVGYQLRHHAGHQLVRARLPALVGRLHTIHVRWAWPDPAIDGWRAHGQDARWWSLAALGTHALDLALWFADAGVTDVAALCEPASGIDRMAEVSLRFATGALAHVSVAVTHRAEPSLVLAGDAGEVACADTLGARGAGTIVHRANREARDLAFTAEDPYLRQLRAFVGRCAGDDPRVDPQAVANVALLHRISSARPA
jgi:predicted dehydrogenase